MAVTAVLWLRLAASDGARAARMAARLSSPGRQTRDASGVREVHTHAPQFAPRSLTNTSLRGLFGDSLAALLKQILACEYDEERLARAPYPEDLRRVAPAEAVCLARLRLAGVARAADFAAIAWR